MTSAQKIKELNDRIDEVIKIIPVTWENKAEINQLIKAKKSKFVSSKELALNKYKKGRYF